MSQGSFLVKNGLVVSSNGCQQLDIRISKGVFTEIGFQLTPIASEQVIDATGKHVFPGFIDTHVHFREPGLTHKATWLTESAAALAGGVTTVFDMPNTEPPTLSPSLVTEKLQIAKQNARCNYGVFLGISAANCQELAQFDLADNNFVALTDDGLYFSGSGHLLADHPEALETVLAQTDRIVALHSEDSALIEASEALYKEKFGDQIPFEAHADIRSEEACVKATERALALAKKHNARLHILHLTTYKEALLFDSSLPLLEKKQTCEVSLPHLFFSQEDYQKYGSLIKYNPSIKSKADRLGLLKGLNDGHVDFITTDHSPHTLEEKQQPYFQSKSGGPLLQHFLPMLITLVEGGFLSLEKLVEKAAENPALFYGVQKRGFIKEGYHADFVIADLIKPHTVQKESLFSKCGWSVFEGHTFSSTVDMTFVNGKLAYQNGKITEELRGEQVEIN
jgi:dihydroorotase